MFVKYKDYWDEWCNLYLSGYTQKEIAQIFGCSRSAIGNTLKRFGIKTHPVDIVHRWYEVNDDFFSKIDTEVKAYWLGFIAADGCIYERSKGNAELLIEVSVKDINHLEQFKKDIGSTHPITITTKNSYQYAMFRFRSKKITADLAKYGIKPRKTLSGLSYPNIDCKFNNSFIRGYFDGDGCAHIHKKGQAELILVGDYGFLESIQDVLENELGIRRKKLLLSQKQLEKYELRIKGNQQVKAIADWMYIGATRYLQRKKEVLDKHFGGSL